MAAILRTTIVDNKQNTISVLYIDSINRSSWIVEMYNYTIRYIRENSDSVDRPIDRNVLMAKDYDDIYHNRKDGFWIVADDMNNTVSLYKRCTSIGKLYNSVYIDLIFVLNWSECPRIVPKIFKTTTLFDNFTDELKLSVAKFRDRSIDLV